MGVGVMVGVGVSVGVGLAVGVGVLVAIGVGVSVIVGLSVGLELGVAPSGVGGATSSSLLAGGAPKEPLPAVEIVGRGVALSAVSVSVSTAVVSSFASKVVSGVDCAIGVVESAVSVIGAIGTPAKKKPKASKSRAKA
jgi:hypothetical protein